MNLQEIMNDAKEHRIKMKISKSSLAKQMGIPAQRITYWESGKSRPRADYFLQYLKLIGFKFDTI